MLQLVLSALLALLTIPYLNHLTRTDSDPTTRYRIAYVPLTNTQGTLALVYVSGRTWCGTGGCNLFMVEDGPDGPKAVGHSDIVHLPVYVLRTWHNGLPDLAVWVEGGGIARGFFAKLTFDGNSYPLNPSMPPAVELNGKPIGEIVIAKNSLGGLPR